MQVKAGVTARVRISKSPLKSGYYVDCKKKLETRRRVDNLLTLLDIQMPATTTLPSKNIIIRFPPGRIINNDGTPIVEENYQLLELPNEILKSIESTKTPLSLVSTRHTG